MEGLQKLLARLKRQHRVAEGHFGQTGNRATQKIFKSRLRGGRERNRIAIAPKPGRDPEDLNSRHFRSVLHSPSLELPTRGDQNETAHPAVSNAGIECYRKLA